MQEILSGNGATGFELESNEYVVFVDSNGKEIKAGWLWAKWSFRHNVFTVHIDGEDLYSNDVRVKLKRKPNAKQTDTSKMKEIDVLFETEKAYAVADGTNGKIGHDRKAYFKYYAKSICIVENGKIYAPHWA